MDLRATVSRRRQPPHQKSGGTWSCTADGRSRRTSSWSSTHQSGRRHSPSWECTLPLERNRSVWMRQGSRSGTGSDRWRRTCSCSILQPRRSHIRFRSCMPPRAHRLAWEGVAAGKCCCIGSDRCCRKNRSSCIRWASRCRNRSPGSMARRAARTSRGREAIRAGRSRSHTSRRRLHSGRTRSRRWCSIGRCSATRSCRPGESAWKPMVRGK
jgi:hypothetical protein